MTGRGWAVLTGALASMVAGRVLGLEDLFLIGAGLVAVVIAAVVFVHVQRAWLGVRVTSVRRLRPARVHAGSAGRVELTLANQSTRRSPVLTVRDPFDRGTRAARFLVAPLAPGELARAAYRVPTDQRGVFDLGPLEISVTDPFGLAAAGMDAAPVTQLTVYPRIDQVPPPPLGHGDDPLAGADHPQALTGGGSDFYALRPYVRGDDLRKVHWPSTAKTDDLMLRQDEMPWQGRATLVLDTRPRVCAPAPFELLVSAVASVGTAVSKHRGLLRLVTTAGFDGRDPDGILEHLAGITPADGTWIGRLAAMARAPGGGALVAFTTALASEDDIRAVAALRTRFSSVTLVTVGTVTWPGLDLVSITAQRPFAAAWGRAAGRTPATPAGATDPGTGVR